MSAPDVYPNDAGAAFDFVPMPMPRLICWINLIPTRETGFGPSEEATRGYKRSMNVYFRREIAEYAAYHRDWWNCAMHVFGIVFLFTGSILPLSLWPVSIFGFQTTVATIMVLPVLAYWLWLDIPIGLGIVGAAVIMLLLAMTVVNYASPTLVWSITAVLIVIGFACQFVGHKYFERRQPAVARADVCHGEIVHCAWLP